MKRKLTVAVIACSMSLIAACSSSSNESSGGNDTTSSASGSTAISPSSGATLAQAKALVAQFEKRPTTSGFKGPPLSKAPPTGKKLVLMNGITQSDPVYGDGLKAAAAVLGWSVEVVNSGTTPESENAAMQQAIQQHVGAIMFPGGDTAVLGSSLALAKQAKIPVFFSNSNQRATGADGNGVYGSLLTGDDVNAMAKLETNWAWADSGGKLKTLGVVVIPSLQTTVSEAAQVKETLGQLCPSCKVKELDAQYTDIGTNIPSQVVAAVRQDPSISYVLFTFGALTTGVSAALKGAGLSAKVKLAGISPNAANLQALVDGTEAMWVVEDKHLIGWRWADSYARFLVGDDVSVENSTLMPNQIMVKDNIQPGDITNYVVDAPYPDTFKALWKK